MGALIVAAGAGAGGPAWAAGEQMVLPASPRDAAVGDVDGDGTAEIVLLIEWPVWSSIADVRSAGPGATEVQVVPAIEVRRELWTLRPAEDRLVEVAPRLAVGRSVVAIDGRGGGGPVIALTDCGPARLRLRAAGATGGAGTAAQPGESRAEVVLELVAEVDSPLARSETVLGRARLLGDVDGDGVDEILVPTARGLAVVPYDARGAAGTADGEELAAAGETLAAGVMEIASSFREVRSGEVGSLGMGLPVVTRLRGVSGTGLLELNRRDDLVVWRGGRRRADGTYAQKITWDVAALFPEEEGFQLLGVSDIDGDGTLEAARMLQNLGDDAGLGEALDAVRGKNEKELAIFALGWDGQVAEEPESAFEMTGHPMFVERADGPWSPFVDLDGDGRAEMLTVRIRIGVMGIARTLASGEASPKVELGGYRWMEGSGGGGRDARGGGGEWKPVRGKMPEVRYRLDLGSGDLSQYARVPGDVTGDGLWDLVEIDERTVRVYPGQAGEDAAPFAESPAAEYELAAEIRTWMGAMFVDLEGDGGLDLLAFEPMEARDDEEMVEPVRVELIRLGGGEGGR